MFETPVEQSISSPGQPIRVTPVVETIVTNASPLEAYLSLRSSGSGSFLLESAELGGKSARFSFIGSSNSSISIEGGKVYFNGSSLSSPGESPVDTLKRIMSRYRTEKPLFMKDGSICEENAQLPLFFGGLAGYISYDFVRHIDNIGSTAIDNLGCKDADLIFVKDLAVFDHATGKVLLISNMIGDEGTDDAARAIGSMKERLASTVPVPELSAMEKDLRISYSVSKERFEEMVRWAKEYILDGDAFQIVLSQRIEVEEDIDPVALYRTLKMINPSPYMYFLEYEDSAIVGSSPEILCKVSDDRVILRPIAGSRPRGRTPEEDIALEAEMKADPKELAEHVMLVDLGRNDAGKVSKFGSVRVDNFLDVEKYSHVQHIVSNVVGELGDGMDAIDVLRATFPAGTVSGAPKTRAMQIIEELEGRKRGLYAGCVGYFCFNNNTDMAIAIRTVLLKNGKAYVQAGAGIVMDSVPENEYIETLNKGAAMLKALRRSVRGGE